MIQSPLSDSDDSDSAPEPVLAASEFRSYGEGSPTISAQLFGLLFQLGITKSLEYKVNSVARPGCMEYTYTV
jgi:hypothetical protein